MVYEGYTDHRDVCKIALQKYECILWHEDLALIRPNPFKVWYKWNVYGTLLYALVPIAKGRINTKKNKNKVVVMYWKV